VLHYFLSLLIELPSYKTFPGIQCTLKNPPEVSWHFPSNFTCLLYVSVYARLQIFIQLPATLTKLCHIKRVHPVHIILYAQNVHHRPKRTLKVIWVYSRLSVRPQKVYKIRPQLLKLFIGNHTRVVFGRLSWWAVSKQYLSFLLELGVQTESVRRPRGSGDEVGVSSHRRWGLESGLCQKILDFCY